MACLPVAEVKSISVKFEFLSSSNEFVQRWNALRWSCRKASASVRKIASMENKGLGRCAKFPATNKAINWEGHRAESAASTADGVDRESNALVIKIWISEIKQFEQNKTINTDIQPPTIACPTEIFEFSTDPDVDYATVALALPEIDGNSQNRRKLHIYLNFLSKTTQTTECGSTLRRQCTFTVVNCLLEWVRSPYKQQTWQEILPLVHLILPL